jgi:hypothetical protein
VKVRKEFIDKTLSFTSDKIQRDSVVLILAEVQVYHRAVQGVCRPN